MLRVRKRWQLYARWIHALTGNRDVNKNNTFFLYIIHHLRFFFLFKIYFKPKTKIQCMRKGGKKVDSESLAYGGVGTVKRRSLQIFEYSLDNLCACRHQTFIPER